MFFFVLSFLLDVVSIALHLVVVIVIAVLLKYFVLNQIHEQPNEMLDRTDLVDYEAVVIVLSIPKPLFRV